MLVLQTAWLCCVTYVTKEEARFGFIWLRYACSLRKWDNKCLILKNCLVSLFWNRNSALLMSSQIMTVLNLWVTVRTQTVENLGRYRSHWFLLWRHPKMALHTRWSGVCSLLCPLDSLSESFGCFLKQILKSQSLEISISRSVAGSRNLHFYQVPRRFCSRLILKITILQSFDFTIKETEAGRGEGNFQSWWAPKQALSLPGPIRSRPCLLVRSYHVCWRFILMLYYWQVL